MKLLLLPLSLLAALVLAACTSDESPTRSSAPGAAFYAELTFEVEQTPDDPHGSPGADSRTTFVRWWYAPDPDRWRWEIETTGTILEDGIATTVFDGDKVWTYDDASNAYQRAVYPTVPEGMIPSPSFSARLGPANLDSVDAFVEEWRSRSTDSDVQQAGEATVLGRRTQIVEIRPAWRGSSESAVAPPAGQTTQGSETSGGGVRIYIDPDRMFIMRWAVDGEGAAQSYLAEIATLDYGTSIDPALFTFDPPPGAREVESTQGQSCGGSSGSAGGGGSPDLTSLPRQSGFLIPTHIPPGYGSSFSGSESGFACETVATTVTLQSPDGAYIILRQRLRPALPTAVASWTPVDVGSIEGYRHSEDGVLSLLWRNRDIVALLNTDSAPFEDLLRIAESAELVP